MLLPGLERLALPTSSGRIPKDVDEAYDRIFTEEQPNTAKAARIPARGDWDHVPESEKGAYRLMKEQIGVFLNPPTSELNIIDEGLRYHGIPPLPPMTRLFLGEWLQGYFVDTHHHLHSPQLSSVHQEAYKTFWNAHLVPLAGATPIQQVSGFTNDDIVHLREAIRKLKPNTF